MKSQNSVWLTILTASGFALYFPGINGRYFGDDFKYVFSSPASEIFHYYCHPNLHSPFYRPIQAMALAFTQSIVGLNTIPVHFLNLLLHVALSFFLYYVLLRLGKSKVYGIIASSFMLVSQANAMAVLSNDTLSQIGGTLFGSAAIWLTYRFSCELKRNVDAHSMKLLLAIGGVSSYAIALWMKESSVSYLGCLGVLTIIALWNNKSNKTYFRQVCFCAFPFILVTVAYLLLRSRVVQGVLDSRYQFNIGFNVLKNAILMFFSAVVPISSVDVFVAWKTQNLVVFFVAIAGAVLLISIVSAGLQKSSNHKLVTLVALLGAINLFPMILLDHVSELYVYNSMPAISLLVGIGLGGVIERVVGATRQILLSSILLLFLYGNIAAIENKALHMKENGDRAADLLRQIRPFLPGIPKDGQLILLNPPDSKTEYSIYTMNGFNVLRYGEHIIGQITGRNDIKVFIFDQFEFEKYGPLGRTSILSLKDHTVAADFQGP